nr:MAG TPA: Protein of unknown function (DUF4017) [Caudoviricetes sp.]
MSSDSSAKKCWKLFVGEVLPPISGGFSQLATDS